MARISRLILFAFLFFAGFLFFGLVLPAWLTPGMVSAQFIGQQQITLSAPAPGPVTGVSSTSTVHGNGDYCYWVVAVYPIGKSLPAGPSCVFGADLVNGSVTVRWNSASGATSYDVLRTAPGASLPTGAASIALATGVVGNSAMDAGGALSSYTVSSTGGAVANFWLNNRDSAQPRLYSDTGFHNLTVYTLTFGDGTTQITAGGGGGGTITGPGSSAIGNIVTWANILGTQIGQGLGFVTTLGNPGSNTNVASEAAVRAAIAAIGGTPGGLSGQIQYNNGGVFGGLVSSSGTISVSAGSVDVTPNTVPYMNQYQTSTPVKCIANALGSGVAYVGTISPALTSAYSVGAPIIFIPDVASTGNFTIDCGLGALNVYYTNGAQAGAGALTLQNGGGVPVTLKFMQTLNGGLGGWLIDNGFAFANNSTLTGQTTFSSNSALSAPQLVVNGNVITAGTGTTTTPHWLLQPTGTTAATSWSTAGTFIGMNAASGFTGNFLDFHVNGGASVFKVDSTGTGTFANTLNVTNTMTASTVVATGDSRAAATGSLYFNTRSKIKSPSDGMIQITNQAGTTNADFTLRSLVSSGTAPGIAGCTATIAGGATVGEITSGTTGACAATLTFAMTAPTGWACYFQDITTPANFISQNSASVTTTTASFTGTTTSGDKIRYGCFAY